MNQYIARLSNLRTLVVGAMLCAVTGCTNETSSVPSTPQANVYLQLDRVGRPGVKEIFEQFADHASSDRAIPSNDLVLKNDITNFNGTGNGTAAAAKLYPDELQLNLAASGNASYLAIETSASGFGGRGLTDTAMELDLNAAYGSQFGAVVQSPCLVSDNLTKSATVATSTFPYLAGPQ